jgi:hypothetical protein
MAGLDAPLTHGVLPDRLMVRLRTLTPSIEVRILVGHPFYRYHRIDLSRFSGSGFLAFPHLLPQRYLKEGGRSRKQSETVPQSLACALSVFPPIPIEGARLALRELCSLRAMTMEAQCRSSLGQFDRKMRLRGIARSGCGRLKCEAATEPLT